MVPSLTLKRAQQEKKQGLDASWPRQQLPAQPRQSQCLTALLIPGAVGITLSGFLSHPNMGCPPQGRLNMGFF